MPRKPLIRSTVHPYHVTARANNKEPFYCLPDDAWRIFIHHLNNAIIEDGAKVHAFVLMPNHFHLLLSTPGNDLGVVMQRLMLWVTKSMNINANRTGRVFGGKYHYSLVSTENHYDYVLKYVYRNPVKAGMVAKVQDYQFSTIRTLIGIGKLKFYLSPAFTGDELIPARDSQSFLDLLNQPFKKEQDDAIRKGLRKLEFQAVKQGWKRYDPLKVTRQASE